MNIIFIDDDLESLQKKYTILELDTFLISPKNEKRTAYALIDNIPITEIHRTQEFVDLHKNLMQNYRKKNWRYCEDAIEHLINAWNGDLRTFYESLSERIGLLKSQDLGTDWDGSISR